MNRQIVKLFAFTVVLFAVLIAFTSHWAVFDAEALKDKEANKRPLLEQQQIRRGRILAADGTVIARSVPKGRGDSLRYVRRYPEGSLFGHPIGYSFVRQGNSEFEKYHDDELIGNESEFTSILDELRGRQQEGNDIVTNIDPEAQRIALEGLQSVPGFGAVVAIEPSTGRVRVLVSNPPYDPNRVPYELTKMNRNELEAPLVDRGTQSRYPPGSTFKVVTATAALESGKVTPSTTFNDPGYCIEYGKKVLNFADQSGPEVFGTVTFAEALENSINAVFCEIGKRFGARAILDQAKKFGFYEKPPIDLPSNEISVSGLYQNGHLYDPKDPNAVDPGRLAFGQERMQVTPLQMALVAAAVANDGTIMVPTLVDRIVDPDGKVIQRPDPDTWKEPMSAKTAAELTSMMTAVVQGGTGVAAQIPGIQVAGKTGTAETGRTGENDTWFIAFAPANDPKVAVAVALSNQSGTGGATAAPIAKEIIEALLR